VVGVLHETSVVLPCTHCESNIAPDMSSDPVAANLVWAGQAFHQAWFSAAGSAKNLEVFDGKNIEHLTGVGNCPILGILDIT